MIPFKKLYTQEELDTIWTWFKEHEAQLPQSLHMSPGIYIPDLRDTLRRYKVIIDDVHEVACYGGMIYHLFIMQEAILQLWEAEGKIPPRGVPRRTYDTMSVETAYDREMRRIHGDKDSDAPESDQPDTPEDSAPNPA